MEEWKRHLSVADRDDKFYELVAGTCKTRMLESFVDFNLPGLMANYPVPMTAHEIALKLGMHPHRARKWLNVLSMMGLVTKIIPGNQKLAYGKEMYKIGPLGLALFGEKGDGGQFYKDNINYHRYVNALDFNIVLKGMPLNDMVRWPPRTEDAARHLEWWMTITAEGAIETIERAIDLSKVHKMLDAAGGEATIACAFAKKYPNLHITVFNLPNSAALGRRNIERAGLADRVSIVELDFLSNNPFPKDFDLVLWSRVLCDWPGEIVQSLLHKTYDSVVPGGKVLIMEPMVDGNNELVIAWEYRYIFYDDFGVACYKTKAEYEALLEDASFIPTTFINRDKDTFYHALIGIKPN